MCWVVNHTVRASTKLNLHDVQLAKHRSRYITDQISGGCRPPHNLRSPITFGKENPSLRCLSFSLTEKIEKLSLIYLAVAQQCNCVMQRREWVPVIERDHDYRATPSSKFHLLPLICIVNLLTFIYNLTVSKS